ncbi:O-methyltransferase [Streptococcus sp. NLN76]|uniref:O-methyltransferase n=1 Tax=Streptococcus sp. NLN76 TaxID=2822800 RepID=UPI0018AC2E2A|nr:O-methyltransferase [Streptococcus sp. NLN76]MBF8969374.1 O-methyltransferase [Streptococcus sp. NLN76]
MVETYSKHSNPNMRRPVVQEGIVDFMRSQNQGLPDFLRELQDFAERENIPIIPKETVAFFRLFLQSIAPRSILEVGTAIGFSALMMAETLPKSQITTIDRNPEMIGLAKENFARYEEGKRIRLLEGEAQEWLQNLTGEQFDLIFVDSAKSKYVVFLPDLLNLLPKGGILIFDDVFQGGDITKDLADIRRGQRAIYRGLHKLFDAVDSHPDLTVSYLPLGDGLLLVKKEAEQVVFPQEST